MLTHNFVFVFIHLPVSGDRSTNLSTSYSYIPGLKVGRMTWVTWVTFLVGQVGLIRKLNYLGWISLVLYKTVLASGKRVNFGSDKCNEMSLVWNQLQYYPKLFWSMWCSKMSSLCKGPVLCSAKNEEIYNIVPYQKFFRSCYITLKKETSA